MDFTLRPWRAADTAALALAANDAQIAANLRNAFPFPYTRADAQAFIQDCMAREGVRQITRAIEVDGSAAGSIGIFLGEDVYEKSAELGYWLARPCWGRGIMTAAVGQICREAFASFDLQRIYAEPFAHNLPSRRVLEKAGFTLEGVLRRSVYKNGRLGDSCVYALLRGELPDGEVL